MEENASKKPVSGSAAPGTPDAMASLPLQTEAAQTIEAMLERMLDGFQAFDREWRYVYLNARAERILGRPRHELLGRVYWEEYPEAVGTPLHAHLLEAMQTGRPAVFEDLCPHEQRPMEFSLSPWPGGLAVCQRDITARRRTGQRLALPEERLAAQDSLQASEERFRLLVEQVKDYAIFMLDAQGHIATWNAGAERFKGYTAEEIIGQHFSRFYTPEDVARRHPWHELEVAAREGRYQEEGWRVRKDGSRFWADVTITALRDPAGDLRGFAKVTRDVTERQARERERNIAQQLQDALQPEIPAQIPGLTIGRYTRPALDEASVGGDFYDVFALDKDLYALVIGDVSGKGLAAAQQLALIRNSLRTTFYLYRAPAPAVSAVNAMVTAHDLLVGFVTCWAGVYDAATGRIVYASCGHEPGLVRRAGGTVEVLETTGPPLGLSEGAEYGEGAVTLAAGDALLLYTDGISEAGPSRRELLGTDGLARLLAELPAGGDAQAQAEVLVGEVSASAGGAFRDDVAVLLTLRVPRTCPSGPVAATDSERPAPSERDMPPAVAPGHAGDNSQAGNLQPLTVALLECVTPADVAAAVVGRGIAVLGACAGLVALLSEDGRDLEVVEARGYDPEMMRRWGRFPISASLPLSDVTREGVPLFITSHAEWQTRYPDMVRAAAGPTRAALGLPLIARGHTLGGLHFSFPDERGFTEEDRAFALELSRQCALALERALARAGAEEAQRRLDFLARASATFSASLEYEATLSAVAHLAVPDFADWCAVDTIAEDGALERLAVAHVDPAKVRWARDLQERYPPDPAAPRGLHHVLRTGETEFYSDIPDAMLAASARDDAHLAVLRQIGLRSAVVAPLTARGRTLGAISFVMTDESGRRFRRPEVSLAEDLARRAAVAVDNARLYREARRSERALRANEARQGAFLRDVLASVTEGKLRLCRDTSDLPTPLAAVETVALSAAAVAAVRRAACAAAAGQGLSEERAFDLETAVSEAATNAVRHAGGGVVRVCAGVGTVQVWVEDRGAGIALQRLPRATLERGFTTAGTLGHGFWFMLRTVDRLWLLTGPAGTTLVLEQHRETPEPQWLHVDA